MIICYWFTGYGSLAPSTIGGQIFLLFFALFGIPLCLLSVVGLSERFVRLSGWVAKNVNLFQRYPKLENMSDIFIIACLGLMVMMFLPSLVFYYIEPNWTFINCIYYTFVTISTIGFGDYVAGMFSSIPIWYIYMIHAPIASDINNYKILVYK